MRDKDSVIIKHLIENKDRELNILQISKEIKMDYKNAYSIIKRLEKTSLIKTEQFGQSSRVKLNRQIHPLIFEAEYSRKKEILSNKNLLVMLNDFKNSIKTKYYTLLLFGSYAKKTQTKNSDIDLLFIIPDGKEEIIEKNISRTAKSLPLPIHYLIFSESQFLEMITGKYPNVGKEALKNNVILHGLEAFYEMTSDET